MNRHYPTVIGALALLGSLIPAGAFAVPVNGTGTGYILVTYLPAADLFTSTRYGAAPLTVSFFDRSLGTIPMTYYWEFGDGSASDEMNPTHTYTVNGEYDVSLTVKNRYGTDTTVLPGYIGTGNPPVADFKATPDTGDIPLVIRFTDTSKNKPRTWKWDFGDGSAAEEQNPLHIHTQCPALTVSRCGRAITLAATA